MPKGEEKPLPKKFDWRDKKVIAEVRNQQTVSGGDFLLLILKHWLETVLESTSWSIEMKDREGSALSQDLVY